MTDSVKTASEEKEERIINYIASLAAIEDAMEPFKEQKRALLNQGKVDYHDPQKRRNNQQEPAKDVGAHCLPQNAFGFQVGGFFGIVPPEIKITQCEWRQCFWVFIHVPIGHAIGIIKPLRHPEIIGPQCAIQRFDRGCQLCLVLGLHHMLNQSINRL